MKSIKLNRIKEGMIVSQDVYDNNQNVLLREGDILDKDKINILQNKNIDRIKIYTNEDNFKINKIKLLKKYKVHNVEELKELIKTKIEKRFQKVKNNKLMFEIMNKTIEYELNNLELDK